MKKSNKKSYAIYVTISLIFLIVALFFINPRITELSSFNILRFGVLCLAILLIHIIKFFRIYFILLEEMLPLSVAIKLYAKTTFINILLPFKLGEFYKIYAYGYKLNNYPKGIYSTIVDKFFDVIILAIILGVSKCLGLNVSMILFVALIAFIVIVLIIYHLIDSTYRYLNRFFIVRGGGSKSLGALRVLEKTHKIYLDIKTMLNGRLLVCMLLSIVAWGIECAAMSYFMGEFRLQAVANYISESFIGASTDVTTAYILGCSVILIAAITLIYVIQFLKQIKWRVK